jgi:ABC-type transport system substrate-binding protein
VTVTDPESLIRLLPCKNQAPFDDVRIRTALNKAVDRDAISEAVFAGTATPAVELWPEGNRFFTEDVADDLAYDPDGAKKLIEEAGSPEVSFLLFSLNGLSLPEVAQVLEQEFAAVGLKAELTISNQLVDQFLAPQAAGAALFPGTPNSGLEKLQDYSGDSLGNVCKYNNSELDGLIAQLSRVSESTDQAVALWDQINTLFANEALGVNLVFSSNLGGYNQSRLTMNSTFPGGLVVFPDIFDSHMNS